MGSHTEDDRPGPAEQTHPVRCGCLRIPRVNVWDISAGYQLVCVYRTICTIPLCTVPYRTVLYRIVLYRTVPYRTVLYYTTLFRAVPYHAVLYCTVLYCTVLYCTVLYCTVPYRTVSWLPSDVGRPDCQSVRLSCIVVTTGVPLTE